MTAHAKFLRDACGDEAAIQAISAAGLDDQGIVGVVMAAAAWACFTTVLDGLGPRLDAETARESHPTSAKR